MTRAGRIARGIAIGLLLASLPILHYRCGGGHEHTPPTPTASPGEPHASHTH